MAITNFIPELWSAAVQVPYEKALVFGQPSVANRDYEGTIRQQGDTVHVTTIDDPTVRNYDKTTNITVEDLNDGRISLVIDQGKYFAFRVNDVDRVQAAGNFESPALSRAGYGLRDAADRFIASLFVAPASGQNAGGPIADNRLGAQTVWGGDARDAFNSGHQSAYQLLVKLREKLDDQSVPLEGRYAGVHPGFISGLLNDRRFTEISNSGTDESLRNGLVGRAAGFDILVSNNLPTSAGATTIVAGVPGALSYADQITETEALRDQNRFADIVRGLNVYGGKIFRREGVASAAVTMTDEPVAGEPGGSGD